MMRSTSTIAVTTITSYPKWYRGKLKSIKNTDKIRGDIALETIKRYKVMSVEVPFTFALKQKENEEKGVRQIFWEKRKNQRLSIIIELLYFINYLLKKLKLNLYIDAYLLL